MAAVKSINLHHCVLVDLLNGFQFLPSLSHVLFNHVSFLVNLSDNQVNLHVFPSTNPLKVIISTSDALSQWMAHLFLCADNSSSNWKISKSLFSNVLHCNKIILIWWAKCCLTNRLYTCCICMWKITILLSFNLAHTFHRRFTSWVRRIIPFLRVLLYKSVNLEFNWHIRNK